MRQKSGPVKEPAESRITLQPDEPETLLFYTATCPKNSDDGHATAAVQQKSPAALLRCSKVSV